MRSTLGMTAMVAIAVALFVIGGSGTVRAQPAGFETFYVLGREAQVYQMFLDVQALESRTGDVVSGRMASVISLTATADFQKIYYDHWEDGYERDILNPAQASTEVLDLNRGQSATFASREGAVAGSIGDYVPADPRGTALRYDGGDKIVSSGGPINVSRALWPEDGRYIGGAWELYAVRTLEQNYRYRVPVGVDSFVAAGQAFSEFRSVYLQVQATSPDTQVVVDNGLTQVQFDLDEGQTWSSRGTIDSGDSAGTLIPIRTGTTVYASKAVQVGMVTAGVGFYQTRFFQIFPETLFGTDYVVPVPSRVSTAAGNRAEIYLFNPNATAVTVSWWDSSGTGSFAIPSRAARAYSQSTAANHYVPVNSAVRLKSTGLIWGIGSGGSDGTPYDWGFSLIPQRFADAETVTAWAPGNYGLTANQNPVYVSAYVPGTTIAVDLDFDGVFDLGPYTLAALESRQLVDPLDRDMSGARIVGSDPFIAAYGCDPLQGDPNNNLDWGNTILPLSASYLDPVLAVTKAASPALLPLAGGRVEFTLIVTSGTRQPLTDMDVVDRLPAGFTYEAGSAWVRYPGGDAFAVEPTSTATGLVWDLSHTMGAGETLVVTFAATVTVASPPLAGQTYVNVGEASCLLVANRFVARDEASVQRSALSLAASVNTSTAVVGDRLVYTVTATNTHSSPLVDVVLTNPVPAATTYVTGSAGNSGFASSYSGDGNLVSWDIGTLAVGATAVVTFAVDAAPAADGYRIETRARATATGLEPVRSNEVVTVIGGGRLVVTKEGPGNVVAGGDLVYRLTANNLGSVTATGVVLEDRIPAGTTYVVGSASPGATFHDAAGTAITPTGVTDANVKTIRWTVGTLPPTGAGQTRSFTVRSSSALSPAATILNVAEASAVNARSAVSNPVITAVSLLRIEKSASRDLARPGHITTFTLDFWNESAVVAADVVVTDAIPARTSYLSGTALAPVGVTVTYSTDGGLTYGAAPAVPAGLPTAVTHLRYAAASLAASAAATATVSFQVRVDNPLPAGTTVENQAGLTQRTVETRVAADGFETGTYTGGTNWAGNWIEVGETDGANAGRIRIVTVGSPPEGSRHLQLYNGNRWVYRAVDLTEAQSATLTFQRRTAGFESDDRAYLDVSINGGGSWTTLRTYTSAHSTSALETVDLSPYVGATLLIRYRVTNNADNDIFYVDDVVVAQTMWPLAASDGFESGNYVGGTGWTGDWLELGENDGPTDGRVQVVGTGTPVEGTRHLRLQRGDRSLYRIVDLSDAEVATLTFLRKTVFDASTDRGYLYVSSDGGTTWGTPVLTFYQADATYTRVTVDLTPYLSAQTAIRFRGDNNNNGDYLYIDDVRVRKTRSTSILSNIVRIPTVDLDVAKVADRTAVVVGDYVWFTVTYSNKGSATATSVVLDDVMTSRLVVDASSISGGGFTTATNRVGWSLGDIPPLSGERFVQFRALVASGAPGTILTNNVSLGNAVDLLEYNRASAWVVVRDTDVTLAPDAVAVGSRGDWVTFAHRLVNTGTVADVVEFRASEASSPWDLASLQYQVYVDVDGDGVYDPGLDTALADGDADGWYETASLAPGAVLRLVVRLQVPSSGVADDDEHVITLTARRQGDASQTSDVLERIRVLGVTAVLLRSFRATGSGGAVVVAWETASETGSVAFRILRSESPDGGEVAAVDGLVMARGARGGASYEVVDTGVTVGALHWYWLEESLASGRTRRYGPVGVDWDGDGMADWWELDHGLVLGLDDAGLDGDGDGRTNLDEFLAGTDPTLADAVSVGEEPPFDEVTGAAAAGLRIVARDDSGAVLELVTPSYAVRAEPAGARPVLPDYVHGAWPVPGEPLVPVKGFFLALPEGRRAGRPELIAVDAEAPTPVPVLRPLGVSVEVEGSDPPRFTEELSWVGPAWSSTQPWPAEAVSLGETLSAGGLPYARISFFPLAWDPAAGTATLRSRILVRIPFVAAEVPSVETPPGAVGLKTAAASAVTASDWSGYPTAARRFFRLRTTVTGLHKLTYDDLTAPEVGWPTGSLPAGGVALFDGTGELPLRIEPPNGSFASGSVLYFVTTGVGGKYDDGSYLFLTPDMGRPGLRMADWTPAASVGATPVSTYRATRRLDGGAEYGYLVPGGDEDRFFLGYSYTVSPGGPTMEHPLVRTLDLTGARTDAPDAARVQVRVATERSYESVEMDHRVVVRVGGSDVASGEFDGAGYADVVGTIPPALLVDGATSVAVALGFAPGVPFFDRVFVDFIEVSYTSSIRARDGRLDMRLPVGDWVALVEGLASSSVVGVRVDGLTGAESFLVGAPEPVDVGGSWSLDLPVAPLSPSERVFIADPSSLPAPTVEGPCADTSLRDDPAGADLVVVAPTTLAAALEPLLAHRRGQGLAVRVVSPEDVYDAFSGGNHTPWAFRSLLTHALGTWAEPRPRYLMLVGDTTWDPRNRSGLLPAGVAPGGLVPTPLLASFGTAGETACDAVLGRPAGDLPTVAVGRLPFRDPGSLAAYVAKVLAYETAPDGLPFESQGLFVAGVDTGSSDPFVSAAEGGIRFLSAGSTVARIVQDEYPTATSVRQAILDAVNGRGALVVNYHGHGNTLQWSAPVIFSPGDSAMLTNATAPTFVVGMSCLDGYFAGADLSDSIAEAWLRRPLGGAVAAYSSAGTSSVPAKQLLNDALFEALYRGGLRRVGDAVLEASRTYLANGDDIEDVVATHALLGDPCLRLRLPFPDAPSGVAVSSLGGGSVRVSWTGGIETDLAGYRVTRSASLGGGSVDVAGGLVAAPTVEIVDTPGSGVWYYSVRAVDGEGFESPPSAEASVTLLPASGGGGGGGCTVGSDPSSAPGWVLPWLLVPLVLVTGRQRRLSPVAVPRREA